MQALEHETWQQIWVPSGRGAAITLGSSPKALLEKRKSMERGWGTKATAKETAILEEVPQLSPNQCGAPVNVCLY